MPEEGSELWEQVMRMAGVGMTPDGVAPAIGCSGETVRTWLAMGELEDRDGEDTEYSRFYRAWRGSYEASRYYALDRLLHSKDEKMVERWLVRTDRRTEYQDWEKLEVARMRRSELALPVVGIEGVDIGAALNGVRARMELGEGEVVEGEVSADGE